MSDSLASATINARGATAERDTRTDAARGPGATADAASAYARRIAMAVSVLLAAGARR